MKRISLFFFIAILTASCAGTPAPIPSPSEAQIEAEERVVYAALLESMYAAPAYVIMDATATDITGISDTATVLERMMKTMHNLDQNTVQSFQDRNKESHPVSALMELGSPYELLSQEEKNALFSQNRDGWQAFYDQHPEAPGITSVSRVGFNDSLDQALVYVGTMSHWLAGAGYYVLMVREQGVWKIDQRVMTWIS